jgi:Zn-dependent protease with chaperone function
MRKILISIWVIFTLGWSGMIAFIYMLGAGTSPGDANVSIGFILYWLVPILVPALVYLAVSKFKSRKPD